MNQELRVFPPFRLDLANEQLWRSSEEIRLRRKTFAVLKYLVDHAGQLVTKSALLDAVWHDVAVSDSMPATSVCELRKALGDSTQRPRFIETVQGRGYRFIAESRLETGRGFVRGGISQPSALLHTPRNPFVGREEERTRLRAALSDAIARHGRLALISGEPGIGKSRLCAELAIEAQAKHMTVLIGHCSEQENFPYLPFIEILDGVIDRAGSVDQLRSQLGEEGPQLARLLPKLTRILPDLPPPPELPPDEARRHLFDTVCNFIAGQSRQRPALIIIEDLHWADDSTLALFAHLAERHAELPILLIGTHRVSDADIGPGLALTLEDLIRGRVALQEMLEGLQPSCVAQMLKNLAGQKPPLGVVGEFTSETNGNPFFIEELFHHLAAESRLFDTSGRYRTELKIKEFEVPNNVRLVVGRRFARLSDASRGVLGTAAVIGRSFPSALLGIAAGVKQDILLDCIDEAVRVGLVRSTPEYTEPRLEFSHELIRQVVLAQQSAARRQALHRAVAQAIERLYADVLEDHYPELAYHCERADDVAKAVRYIHLAASQASRRSAYREAVALLSSGLELIKRLPESEDRDRQELRMRTVLGPSLMETSGDASPEVLAAYPRAQELSAKLGERPGIVWALEGLFLSQMVGGQLKNCLQTARRLLAMAEERKDPEDLLWAHGAAADASFWLGDLALAHSHFERARSYYNFQLHRHLVFRHGMEPGAALAGYSSWPLWMMGFPDQARRRSQEAMEIALQRSHLSSLAMAYSHSIHTYLNLRDVQKVREQAEAGMAVAKANGFQLWAAYCLSGLGAAEVLSGRYAEGIAQLEEGLRASRATGAVVGDNNRIAILALAYGSTEQSKKGLKLIDDAFATILETGELPFEAELHRVKGELLLMQQRPDLDGAEDCFGTAIEHAREHAAKSWELRATMSLARLMARRRKRDEARRTLAEVYAWFTEGFDTGDLKDAKNLLDGFNP